jgi:serine/threonine protein kinase
MATSPRASAPTASSAGGWTIVRPFGARAIPTHGATQGSEALFIQNFRLEEGQRSGDPVRDLRALVNLRHTNVARVKEVIENDREITVVSHYVEGETLAALRAAGPIALGIQLRILVDVLAGLAAIHGVKDSKLKPLGIVHGEVAPANIVVGTDGVPKVIQLCGVHAAPGSQGADTLGYLAPEILLADDAFDQRVDIYAVGVMLWEALSGAQLFPETNPGAIVTRHLSGRIRRATVPADAAWAEPLVDVAQKAIATDPNGRYANVNELANEIKRIAKTNLASTMKVSVLVKERGTDAIAARRAVLGMAALPNAAKPIARPQPKPFETSPSFPGSGSLPGNPSVPAKAPQIALKPVPTPVDAAPTTKPVAEQPTENLSESAVKPAVRFPPPEVRMPPPEPSAHDRITLKTPIPGSASEEEITDFSDLAMESEPPPPPVGPPKFAFPPHTEMHLSAPITDAETAPAPVIASTPMFTPPPEPVATPFGGTADDVAPVDDEQARKKRRGFVFIAIGACALLLVIGSIRACMKSGPPDTAAKPAPTETTKPVVTAPTVAATPEPTETAKPVDTAPTATATAVPTETAKPPVVAENPKPPEPTVSPKGTSTWTAPPAKPTATSTSKVKPKTYDPLGI